MPDGIVVTFSSSWWSLFGKQFLRRLAVSQRLLVVLALLQSRRPTFRAPRVDRTDASEAGRRLFHA